MVQGSAVNPCANQGTMNGISTTKRALRRAASSFSNLEPESHLQQVAHHEDHDGNVHQGLKHLRGSFFLFRTNAALATTAS